MISISECPDIMTPRHVAKLLGISEQTVRRQIGLGEIPGFRIGRNLFVAKKHFLALIDGAQHEIEQ